MTGTPDLEIFDSHVHLFSPPFFKSLSDQLGPPSSEGDIAGRLGWDVPETAESLADCWVGELDRNGVSRAMLIASTLGDAASVGTAVTRYPNRFRAVYMLNPMLPGADMRLSSAISEHKVSGFFLFPAMHHYSVQDHHVRSLLGIVSSYAQTVVYLHCGALSMGFRRKLGLPSPFDLRYSNPVDLQGVAHDYPQVPFVIPHFGAGFFREALMVAEMCPNVYLDTSSSNGWMRWQSGDLDLKTVFSKALDVVGPRRLLFGSDSSWFPRGWVKRIFQEQRQALDEIGAPEETVRAIFGGNLRALLLES
jgi:predicted TIM-barrel fold metal-dependent hydrolase